MEYRSDYSPPRPASILYKKEMGQAMLGRSHAIDGWHVLADFCFILA